MHFGALDLGWQVDVPVPGFVLKMRSEEGSGDLLHLSQGSIPVTTHTALNVLDEFFGVFTPILCSEEERNGLTELCHLVALGKMADGF